MNELQEFDDSPVWRHDFASRAEIKSHLFAGSEFPLSERESQGMDDWVSLYVAQHRNNKTRVLRKPVVREAVRNRLHEQGVQMGAIGVAILLYYVLAILLLWRQLRRGDE